MAKEGGSAAGGRAMLAGQMGLPTGGGAMLAGQMGSNAGGWAMPAGQMGSNAGGGAMLPGQMGLPTGGGAMLPGQMGLPTGGGAMLPGQMGLPTGGGAMLPGRMGLPTGGGAMLPWRMGLPTGGGAMLAGQMGLPTGGGAMLPGQMGLPTGGGAMLPWRMGSAAGGGAMPARQMDSAAGDRMIPQSKQPLRLTQLINDDDTNFKKLKTVTKYLNNAQNFDEKLNRLGEFIRWHDDLTKAQSSSSSIKYWSWLILYTKIKTLTGMCLSRNKQNNKIEGINQTNINKIKELFQMSPLNKRVPVDDAGNFVSYIINGIKENETVNFRKFFADQSGGKFIFDQLEEYNRQLKNDPTEQQKKAIQSYINCKENPRIFNIIDRIFIRWRTPTLGQQN